MSDQRHQDFPTDPDDPYYFYRDGDEMLRRRCADGCGTELVPENIVKRYVSDDVAELVCLSCLIDSLFKVH